MNQREIDGKSVCMHVCVCVCTCMCVCICLCERARERERGGCFVQCYYVVIAQLLSYRYTLPMCIPSFPPVGKCHSISTHSKSVKLWTYKGPQARCVYVHIRAECVCIRYVLLFVYIVILFMWIHSWIFPFHRWSIWDVVTFVWSIQANQSRCAMLPMLDWLPGERG